MAFSAGLKQLTFWIPLLLFKNQKVGIVTEVEVSEPFRDDNVRVAGSISVGNRTKA
ncbi:Hypothetical predicted protein, partial [Paramuricea clavata]